MTPTTSAPSIILLNPTTQVVKPAATSDAQLTPDAALSGFQLLLGAMQQTQQKLPISTGEGATATKNSDKPAADSGNALPLLGTILPLAGLPQATPDATAKADGADTSKCQDSTKSKDKKDQDASVAGIDPMQPVIALPSAPAGLVIQSPRANSNTTTATASTDAVAIAQAQAQAGTDVALAAQSDAGKDAEAGRSGNKAVVPMPVVNTGSVDTPVGVNSNSADIAAAGVKDLPGSSKPAVESDFDALIKHLDISAPTQLPATNNVSDNSSVHQASRTYFDAANNTTSVSVPVGSNGWSDAITDKVMWFSANKISSAEIHLNPPDLGPLQVRVSTQHDQASIVFTSQHAAVRDALDQALPRLRDMMSSQGMHQLDVSVGGQSAQQHAQQQFQQQQFGRHSSSDRGASLGGFFSDDSSEAAATSVTSINTARLLRSGVDAYA